MGHKRTIVIGDVHACLSELDELLLKVQFSRDTDRVVLLGDLLDRGPDGIGVVRRARELGLESVMGNHCYKHVRWRKHEEQYSLTGKKNPMRPFTPERLRENASLSDDDFRWLRSLPFTIDLGNNWVAVHGGFEPNIPIYSQKENTIVSMRYLDKDTKKPINTKPSSKVQENAVFWAHEWCGPENVIYGHAVHGPEPLHTKKTIEPPFEALRDVWPKEVQTLGLDTGCCFGLKLSAAITTNNFNSWEVVQVQAKQNYYGRPVIFSHH